MTKEMKKLITIIILVSLTLTGCNSTVTNSNTPSATVSDTYVNTATATDKVKSTPDVTQTENTPVITTTYTPEPEPTHPPQPVKQPEIKENEVWGKVNIDSLYVRKEASTDAEVVTKLSNDQYIKITKLYSVPYWHKVELTDGTSGYCCSKYLVLNYKLPGNDNLDSYNITNPDVLYEAGEKIEEKLTTDLFDENDLNDLSTAFISSYLTNDVIYYEPNIITGILQKGIDWQYKYKKYFTYRYFSFNETIYDFFDIVNKNEEEVCDSVYNYYKEFGLKKWNGIIK